MSTTHQSLGIYVPQEYMTCTQSSGLYTCTVNSSGTKGSYTASNAPLVFPVNTSGYSAMKLQLHILIIQLALSLKKESYT